MSEYDQALIGSWGYPSPDYDKTKPLFSPKKKIKQWSTSSDLREWNIADNIMLTESN